MRNRNLSVGLFVVAALAIGGVLTVWFTGKLGDEPMARYQVLIDSDVSGLTLGGPVFFMGVQVGDVANLSIVPGNPARVRVVIRVRVGTPVDTATWATLAAQGITGVSVINLYHDAGEGVPLAPPPGEDLPVIPYRDTGFSALLSGAPRVLDKIDELLTNANALLGENNRQAVNAVLTDVERLTDALAAQEDRLATLPGALEETLTELRGVIGQVDVLLADAGPQASAAMVNVASATARLDRMTERLDGWLERHDEDMRALTADGLAQVPALMDDTRDALRELEKLLESLRQDPSRALYQPASNAIVVEE